MNTLGVVIVGARRVMCIVGGREQRGGKTVMSTLTNASLWSKEGTLWWRREWKNRVDEAEVYNLDLDVALVRRDRASWCVDVMTSAHR